MLIFKSVWAILTSVILFFVGLTVDTSVKPVGAEVISRESYTLEEALLRAQGVTNDGENYYFSANFFLSKVNMKTGEKIKLNLMAIPFEFLKQGCNHIGGISYYDGKIYAAIEDGSDYVHPVVAVFDANTLKYTGKHFYIDTDLLWDGVPWCAVDEKTNCIYVCNWSHGEYLYGYDINSFELVKTIKLSQPLDRIQGAEFYDGFLYASCDEKNDMKRIFKVDVSSGEVSDFIIRNIGKGYEAEGMTVTVENGKPVFHVLDVGKERLSLSITKYKTTG